MTGIKGETIYVQPLKTTTQLDIKNSHFYMFVEHTGVVRNASPIARTTR